MPNKHKLKNAHAKLKITNTRLSHKLLASRQFLNRMEAHRMAGMLATVVLLLKEMFVFVSFIKNNAFPQPLTEKDEEKNLILMAEGDAIARNTLIEHNLRLVAHIVKKFENTGEDTEDLISIGTIGLIKAIESYQTSKGTKLATYAARCIENEILMHLRSLKKAKKDVSLHDPIGTDKEGNELTLTVYLCCWKAYV